MSGCDWLNSEWNAVPFPKPDMTISNASVWIKCDGKKPDLDKNQYLLIIYETGLLCSVQTGNNIDWNKVSYYLPFPEPPGWEKYRIKDDE